MQIGGFAGIDRPPIEDGILRELKATSYLSRQYEKNGIDTGLFVAYYAQQRAGESMHSPKHCLPGGGWEIWSYDTVRIPVGLRDVTINQYSISNAGDRRVVLYWYQSRTEVFASEFRGKFLLARDALLRNSTAAAIVRIIVPDRPEAVDEARKLASEIVLQMERCFGTTPTSEVPRTAGNPKREELLPLFQTSYHSKCRKRA